MVGHFSKTNTICTWICGYLRMFCLSWMRKYRVRSCLSSVKTTFLSHLRSFCCLWSSLVSCKFSADIYNLFFLYQIKWRVNKIHLMDKQPIHLLDSKINVKITDFWVNMPRKYFLALIHGLVSYCFVEYLILVS